MKTIFDHYDKALLADLPRVTFPGRIVVVISQAEAIKAVDYLLKQSILGFDTETKPSFARGRGMNKVALLQVATHDTCFLFRLNQIGLTDSIIRLLSDTRVTKVALSWHDDIHQLQRRREFQPGHFIELQKHCQEIGIEDMALQKLYANLFGEKIAKGQQLSNWENDTLTPAQCNYASIDAWACIRIYEEIERLRQSGDYQLVHRELPVPPRCEKKEDDSTKPSAERKSSSRSRSKGKSKGRKSEKKVTKRKKTKDTNDQSISSKR